MEQIQESNGMLNVSGSPDIDSKDEDLELLMEVDSNVKIQVEKERKKFRQKLFFWIFVIILLATFFTLEVTHKTQISKKLSPYLNVEKSVIPEEGNVVTLPMSGRRPPLLVPKSTIDKNLPDEIPTQNVDENINVPIKEDSVINNI